MGARFTSLTTNRMLVELPLVELEPLQPHLQRVRLVNDQVLLERGQVAEHVYFIEVGIVLLETAAEANKPGVQIAMIGREGMVGGLALLNTDSLTLATAVTRISGIALRIPVIELRRCFNDSPVFRNVCLRYIQSLTRQIMGSTASNASNTLTERCAHWLLMAHDRVDGDDLPVTHEALSTLLGVRCSSVTVATAALQQAGLIRPTRGRIRILDRPGLEALISRNTLNNAHGASETDRELSSSRNTKLPEIESPNNIPSPLSGQD